MPEREDTYQVIVSKRAAREPHHPSMSAMGGASKVLDLGLISTVQPGLRSRTPLGLQHRVEAKEGG